MSLVTQKAASIVALFATSEANAEKAGAQVKAAWPKKEDARVALIPAVAANPRYKGAEYNVSASTGLATGWASGKAGSGGRATNNAKRALNRLLRLAYLGKKANKSTDDRKFVASEFAARFAKSHTPSQIRRAIDELKAYL